MTGMDYKLLDKIKIHESTLMMINIKINEKEGKDLAYSRMPTKKCSWSNKVVRSPFCNRHSN